MNMWSDLHDQQGHMPIGSNNHGPAAQPGGQIASQPILDNVIQGCPCAWCSRNGYNPQTVRRSLEYQGPYENQNLGGNHAIRVAGTMDCQTQVWSVAPQAPYDQEDVGYASLPRAVDPLHPQVQTDGTEPDQVQILDIPVSERLRRLAGRYVNNPESLVNGVHLESGPSGRFQVVITVEIGDVLGDTMH